MPTFDVEGLGRKLIPAVLGDNGFKSNGFTTGESNGVYYAIINPKKYKLFIWKRSPDEDYIDKGKSLGAVVFTNGPQMGPPDGRDGKKVLVEDTLDGAQKGGAVGMGIGALILAGIWFFSGPIGWGVGAIVAGSVLGGAAGGVKAMNESAESFLPFGKVRGVKHGIDEKGTNVAGTAWFGRKTAAFVDYKIALGAPDMSCVEVSAGLIILLLDFAIQSTNGGFKDFFKTSTKIAAWGLVPFPFANSSTDVGTPPSSAQTSPLTRDDFKGISLVMPGDVTELDGVIVALGVDENKPLTQKIPAMMKAMGVRDAAAVDGGQATMMGSGIQLLVKPTLYQKGPRNKIGKLGFYCKEN